MDTKNKKIFATTLVLACVLFFIHGVFADPTGASISNNSTENGPTISPDSHAANRSTITTLILDSTQQDTFWKGYVGNVTGTLSLDDAAGFTIYDWNLATITGEVYATRTSSIDLGSIGCALAGTITSENTFNNMSQGQVDTINATFNETAHAAFVAAGTSITADTCPSQALHVSDARQTPSSSADFQEILLEDGSSNLLYVALINDGTTGFDNQVYDFQMILAESNVKSTPTTYYFYLELG